MFSIEEMKLSSYSGRSAEQIVIPDGVQTLGKNAFLGHDELRDVTLSAEVKTLSDGVFRGCVNLEKITLSPALKRLGADCFRGCTALRSMELPQSVASIRSGAFAGCSALQSVEMSSGLRRVVETETFAGCSALESIVIPAQVELIEYKAFSDCVRLRHVSFENPELRIEEGAFVGCEALDEETALFVREHSFSSVVVEIRSSSPGPAGRLSNFTARQFVFDGVQCGSIEGVLQSLKCPDAEVQREICRLSAHEARNAGMPYSWQERQELYWLGQAYPRSSKAYQQLLDRLYEAVFEQDAAFREDLTQVRGRMFSHRLGRVDPAQTVLTRKELTDRLRCLSLRSKAVNE